MFGELLNKMNLAKTAQSIKHDAATLCEIKNGTVKPSGRVYLSMCQIIGSSPRLENLEISSRNYDSIKVLSESISPELVGLLHSDGILRKNKRSGIYFFFCNQQEALVKRFKNLLLNTFECKFFEFKDKRDETYYVYPPSIIGRILINRLGEKRGEFLPPKLLDKEIADYFRGLFDGDGTILLQKSRTGKVCPRIRITTKNRLFAEEAIKLLGRVSIYSRLQFETSNGNKWWNIDIARKESVLNFIKKIGSFHPKKKKRMECALKYLGSLFPVV